MKAVIVDSSVIVKWLNKTKEQNLELADKILKQARQGSIELFTPELAKYEVGNVLITKKINPSDVKISLNALYSVPLTFVTESIGLAKITYSLAALFKITYYDASFLSLAKQYGGILITENIKHQGKKAQGITVIALKDY